MRFDILTLFPGMFVGPFNASILKRARERGYINIHIYNIRSFAFDKHRVTDDYPYGGGAGMVMKVEPLVAGVEAVLGDTPAAAAAEVDIWSGAPAGVPQSALADKAPRVILLTPSGKRFDQELALELAREPRLVFLCGHYEGIDERVRQTIVTDELSIGDYVLTGGELAAMVVVDAVARLQPGVLGDAESHRDESFSPETGSLLEYPHYTRPPVWRGQAVPDVLLSGNHAAIARWRREQALRRTLETRPDLIERSPLSATDQKILASLRAEQQKQEREGSHDEFDHD